MSDASRLFGLSAVKDRKIKMSVGCRCENCQAHFPVSVLEIHAGPENANPGSIAAESVVVLCPSCHRSLHQHGPELRWRLLLSCQRKPEVHEQISSILNYHPAPYEAPEGPPLPELFEDAVRGGGIDLYQNGA